MGCADSIPASGEVLANKYRIERVLGQGGMGIVHAAMHLHLEERVAIKFLLPEVAQDPALVARFLREGRTSIKIRSEHVVRVLDVATLPGGTPYMVMEYLEGTNLEDLVESAGPLSVQVAVDHLLQATEAIAEAHALGMVHRDLKPANLFLSHRADGSPSVKVLDFGITKILDASGETSFDVTQASVVMGSPRYMSPEQMRSTRPVDTRADIWSLGVILQELITGVPPFDGATMTDLLASILQDAPLPLSRFIPDAPPGLAEVLARCLEKDPDARYNDVAEFATALAPFGSTVGQTSAERVARVIRARSSGHPTRPPAVVTSARPSRPTASTIPPPPSSNETLTISATANISPMSNPTGAPGPRPAQRSAARTFGAIAAGAFVTSLVVIAIMGARGGEGGPRAGSESSVARPPTAAAASRSDALDVTRSESGYGVVELAPPPTPTTTPGGSGATAGATAGASPSTVAPDSSVAGHAVAAPLKGRGAAALGGPPAPSAWSQGDLFDGRK